MIRVGIIGCGYWGPNHIRVFSQLPDSQSVMCADPDEKRLKHIQGLYPAIKTTKDYQELLKAKEVDAVVISVPTNLHFKITKEALLAGKHVLCEKPLALTPKECAQLKTLAAKQKRVLMVGHVFVFNAGISWVKKFIESGELGRIHYAYSTRINLGPFRYDVNALWDLAPHDISIFNYLFNAKPLSVIGHGQKVLGTSLEDLAFAHLQYPDNLLVNIHVSWLDPKKVRQITIVGDKKMLVWDDLDSAGPVKVYDKHVEKTSTYYATYGEFQLLSQEGNTMIPKIDLAEPLKAQGSYFLECVKKDQQPINADAQKGMDVVETLCGIQESINKDGKRIKL
ncbi:MAG TPA: Gfo/Idh/MocA family oxidoreductase [Candidatus Omnitrophota bacterium]|nr:Gfo/Idh/MocA family oxidoreductase [Candidatus Omnitrophota bacterium]